MNKVRLTFSKRKGVCAGCAYSGAVVTVSGWCVTIACVNQTYGRASKPSGGGVDVVLILRIILLVAVAAVLVWLALTVRLPELAELRDRLDALGPWALFVFTVVYALVALTPIPVAVMSLAGGLMFGVIMGSLLSIVGSFAGAVGAYGLARVAGGDLVMRGLGRYAGRIEEGLADERRGFLAVLTLRAAPGLPYWPLNYGAGAVGFPFAGYAAASALGVIPGQLSLVAIGAFIAHPDVVHGIVVAAAWAAVIVLTVWGARRWTRTRSAQADVDRS